MANISPNHGCLPLNSAREWHGAMAASRAYTLHHRTRATWLSDGNHGMFFIDDGQLRVTITKKERN